MLPSRPRPTVYSVGAIFLLNRGLAVEGPPPAPIAGCISLGTLLWVSEEGVLQGPGDDPQICAGTTFTGWMASELGDLSVKPVANFGPGSLCTSVSELTACASRTHARQMVHQGPHPEVFKGPLHLSPHDSGFARALSTGRDHVHCM